MNIFYRRPLSIILLIILGGFSVFPFLTPIFKALFASSALFLVLVSSFLTIRSKKISFFSICSLLLLLSILLSFFYFDFYAKPEDRFDKRCTIEGKIYNVQIIDEEDGVASYTIRTSKIDGKSAVYKLTFSTEGILYNSDVKVGSVVSLSGKVSGFDTEDTELRDYYFSTGIFGTINSVTNIDLISSGLKPLSYYTQSIRDSLTDYAISVSNDDTGTLLSALLFGERQALKPSVKTSFTAIGIAHILALSGMHVNLLCAAINQLLLLLRIGRKERLITTVIFSIAYMILTGMSVSVVRAAIMLIITQLLTLLFKSSDSVTNLFISVFIIILVSPYSVYSVSLWLSAFATLGVILSLDFTSLIPYKKSIGRHILRFVFTSLVSSVFALMSTLLISTLVFKKFYTLSILSTLVFSILIEIIMYIGALMLIVGKIIPVSVILNPIVDLTARLAGVMSKIKGSVIFTHSFAILFIVITTLIFVILIVVKIKSKPALLATVITLLLVSSLPIMIYGAVSAETSSVYYSCEADEDVLIVKDAELCHVISYGSSYRNNGYKIYEELLERNIHSVDSYILFEISDNTVNEMSTLLSRINVRCVLLPRIYDDEPKALSLNEYLLANGVSLEYFDENIKYSVNNFSFLPVIYDAEKERQESIAFLTELSGNRALYLSSGIMKSIDSHFLEGMLSNADTLILGKFGASYSESYYLDSFCENLGEIIFSGDNVYLTPDMAERYEENGCKLTSHPSTYKLFD